MSCSELCRFLLFSLGYKFIWYFVKGVIPVWFASLLSILLITVPFSTSLKWLSLNLVVVGIASVHFRQPGRAWHAGDHLSCFTRHNIGENIWWSWPKDPMLRVSPNYSTGLRIKTCIGSLLQALLLNCILLLDVTCRFRHSCTILLQSR